MSDKDGSKTTVINRIRAEWPAVLAVIVLAFSHVFLTVVRGDDVTPIGLPLFIAVAVFLVAEFGRRLVN